MTGIDSYSTTPATNATADGGSINWAEGQPPSSVNNTARQWMADTRSRHNDLIWFQYGTGDQGSGNLAVPSVYASGTSFTITGADVTTVYHAFRRVRAVGSSTGTIYGTITSSSYSSGNTTTTVNVAWDSGGSLLNETLTISLSQIPKTGAPLSGVPSLINVITASSSASLIDTSSFSTAYRTYRLIFNNLIPATDAQSLTMLLSTDGGSTYDTGSNYTSYGTLSNGSGGGPALAGDTAASSFNINCGNQGGPVSGTTNSGGLSGAMTFYNPSNAAAYKRASWDFNYTRTSGGVCFGGQVNAVYLSTTAVNAFKFLFASGNISSGNIEVYGVP